ncbi:hypothetical protein [Marinoscillum sp. MHG1-6]|uniref:hypothetical protein n=1 Tax=Marinoscillum sp. MHG1-6 TaxID=2959627 RepID=UPI0021571603|nr:hypothetical protein [Marinoscillum sp. MHG1-6]
MNGTLIWYNPDLGIYEKGSLKQYDRALLSSTNKDRFDILYEFSEPSMKLTDKVLNSLNAARSMFLDTSAA